MTKNLIPHGADWLSGQPQYEKYIKCHELRVQPCTFGVKSTSKCESSNPDGGPGGNDGGGGGSNACFSFGEFYLDNAPMMDAGDLSRWVYCYDAHFGDDYIDMGSVTEPVDEKRITSFVRKLSKAQQSIC